MSTDGNMAHHCRAIYPDGRVWRLSIRALLVTAFIGAQTAIAQECSYEGGWALRNEGSCPPSAPVECGTGAQPRCCPSGFSCTGDGDYVGNYCCLDPADCRALALEHPKCPDSAWKLWGVNGRLDNGGWCCMADQNGVYRDNGEGIALLCTKTTATVLPQSHFWAKTVDTVSCSTTSTSTTSTTAATDTPTSTGTSTPVETTEAVQPVTNESSSMSTGAIAGIAVGGVAGGALLVAGIFFLWRRKRKLNTNAQTRPTTGREVETAWAYDAQTQKTPFGHGQGGANELATQELRAEMDSSTQPTFELDAQSTTAHELDSSHTVSRPIQRDEGKFR